MPNITTQKKVDTSNYSTRFLAILALLLLHYGSYAQCGWAGLQENGNTYYPAVYNQTVNIGSGAFLRFQVKNTATYHFETCGSGYDTQLSGFNGSGGYIGPYSDDACGTSSSMDWGANYSGEYRVQNNRYNCQGYGSGSAVLTFRCAPPASPSAGTAGNGTWYVYCYAAGDANGGSGAWSSNYSGYYTESNLSFSTGNRWTNTPYDASDYLGCYVPNDNHSWRAVRTGICGYYSIDINGHDDSYQLLINGSVVAQHMGGCCDAHAGAWTGFLNPSDVVEFRVSEGGGGSNGQITFNRTTPATPAGNGTWNVYVWGAGDATGGSGAWSTNYSGMYTEPNLSFESTNRWGNGGTPSSASGYTGCAVGADNHSWSAKRTGFTCKAYQILVNHDDRCQVYVNGVLRYDNSSCCFGGVFTANQNVGTFALNASDIVEMRVSEGGGGSFGSIALNDVTATLSGGTINYGGSTTVCTGYDPPAFGNSADASGGTSAAVTNGSTSYQWELNGGNIGGATASTYDPGALTTGTYTYRRKVTDKCGNTAYSNSFTITVNGNTATAGSISPSAATITLGSSVAINSTVNATAASGTTLNIRWYRISSCANSVWEDLGQTNSQTLPSNTPSGVGTWTYLRRAWSSCGAEGNPANYDATTTVTVTTPPGNPATFGSNTWNAYVYCGNNTTPSNNIYQGYYVDGNFSFNTANVWVNGGSGSPSNLIGGYTYNGGSVGADYHSVIYKRQGFPCRVYRLDVPTHDDDVYVYVNGALVLQHNGCCDAHNGIWTGVLSSTDNIEYRFFEGGGGSQGALNLVDVTTTLSGGTINYSGSTLTCGAYDPPAFTNGADASGGASAAITNGSTSYQWQLNGSDIGGATSSTYDVPNITTAGTYVYRRKVTDKCGNVAYSNTQTIVVNIIPSSPADGTAGSNAWNVFAYNSATPGTNYYGYYTQNTLDFNTDDRWSAQTAAISTTTINTTNGSGYTGCTTGVDNFSYRYKRQGFPCGIYTINVRHDDNLTITKNGSTVLYNAGCCINALSSGATNVFLGANTTLDVACVEGGGNAFTQLTFGKTGDLTITSSNATMCHNAAARTLTANVAGGTWSGPGVSGSTFTPATAGAGTHTITYTLEGCTATQTITVNQTPTPTIGTITSPTCALATGSVALSNLPASSWTVTASPGGATITGSTTTATFSGLTANTTYTFTVTQASTGCTSSTSANAVIPAQPVTSAAPVVGTITPPTCTVATGSVALSNLPAANWTVTASPGGATITGSTTTATFTGLTANTTYTFTVTLQSSGCTSVPSGNAVIPAQPVTPSAPTVGTITSPTCTVATGSVALSNLPAANWTVTASPGGATITGNTTTTTFSGLAGNTTYTFTVTLQSSGCTSAASGNAVIPAQPATPSAPVIGTITQPTCGTATGSIALSSLPASGTWTLTRNPGAVTSTGTGTTTTVSSLPAGTYTFTVTNASGCVSASSANAVVNTQPTTSPPPTIGTITQPTCAVSTGSVALSNLPASNWTVTASPGGATITGNTTTATFSGLTANTTYTFTTTLQSSGCTSVASANAVLNAQPVTPAAPVIGIITQPTCALATASVALSNLPASNWTVTASPGGATIAGNTTTASFTGLTANTTYTFTVTLQSSGCTSAASGNAVINAAPVVPTAPVVGTITQPTCALATASVALSVLPASNWTVTANPGGATITGNTTTATFSGLTASTTYTFTVTLQSSGCTSAASGNAVINAAPVVPTAPTIGTITQPTCAIATGSVALSGLPASNWTVTANPGGATITGNTATATFGSLPANTTYNFTVTLQSSGCTSGSSANAVINAQPATPPAPVVGTITQPTCAVATASVDLSNLPGSNWTVTASPGGATLTGNTTTATFGSLTANTTYTFTTTLQSSGCVSSPSGNAVIDPQPVTPAAPVVGTITQPSCSSSTGSVDLSNLPASNWTVTASPGGATLNGSTTTATFTGLAGSTTYTFTVTLLSSGCTSAASGNAVINAAPVVPTAPVIGTITSPTCAVATGSVALSGLPASNWTITAQPGGFSMSGNTTTATFVNLPGGTTYTFTVTLLSSGCTSAPSANAVMPTQPVTPSAPVVSVINGPTCSVATGSVDLTNLPASNWTVTASPGGATLNGNTTTATFSGLTANTTYTFTVTLLSSGCTSPASGNAVIPAQPSTPSAPVVDAVTQPGCVVTTGSASLSGLPTSSWVVTATPGGATISGASSNATFSGLAANTTYTFTVTLQSSGCTSSASSNAVIGPLPTIPPVPTAYVSAQPTCVVNTGSITVLSPVGSGYEYAVDGGTYTASNTITGIATGTHTVTVRLVASPDCVSDPSGTLTVNSQPTPPTTAPVFVCQGGTGSLTASSICVDNFAIPALPGPNQIYGGWLASDATAATLSGANNSSTCAFAGPVRTYSAIKFQVSATGNYIFEMNDNSLYNGAGYIVTGNFTPGSCSQGTLVRADNDGGIGDEPKLGTSGNPLFLYSGITYTLVSTTDGGSNVVNQDYTWTVTPPAGENVLTNQPGNIEWYTAASGGSPIYVGTSFNPVGVAGSGLTNTNTAGTTSYWAACSSSPSCRTQADYTITTTTTLFNVTPANSSTCYDAGSPISIGLSGSINGLPYQIYRDGSTVGMPSPTTGNGGPISLGSVVDAGIYTVSVHSGSCDIPMNGSVEIKPAPIANAGSDVTLNCSSNVVLNGTSNNTTVFTEDFGTGVSAEVTSSTSNWKIKYLYGTEPQNRTEWWITYNGATPLANMSNPVNNITSGSGLTLFDHRIYEPVVPGDYAWDEGTVDEVAYNTTPIDARFYTTVNLSFNYQVGGTYSGSNVYDYLQVMYSLDNGTTWVPVSAGNNAGTYNLYRGMGSTNAFFANSATTGTANVTMPAAVVGKKFLLGFRWVNDGDLTGAYVGGPMVDNINITGTASYSWSPTAGVTGSTTATPTITQGGTYTVVVTAGNGCTASDQVVVTNAVAPTVTIVNNADVCSGGNVTLTANSVGGTGAITNIKFERSANGGGSWATVQDNTTNANYTTSTSLGVGNYLYRATVTLSSNCSGTSANAVADVKADPMITDEPLNQTICVGGSAAMTVAATGGTPNLLYEWEYDNGTIVTDGSPAGVDYGSETTPALTINTNNSVAAGTIPIWVKVYANGNGCDAAYSLFADFTVVADPTVSNPTPATQTGLCSGGSASPISVTANGGTGAYSYQWYSNTTNSTSGGSLISGANNTSYTPPAVAGTTYYYCEIGQAGSGCGPVTTATTAVVTAGTPVVANVVVDECMNFALGDKYYVLVTGSGGTPPYTYPGSFYTSTTNQGIHELNAGASGTYTVTDAAGCSTTSSAVTAPTGRPNDIVMTSATGNITVDCWINDYNKWVTFRDAVTNNAIMAINDNHSNLGLVTVDVYKDATPPVIYNNPLATNCTWTQHTAMRRHFKMTSTLAPTTGVDVMLFFSDDDYNTLKADAWNNNTGYPNPNYACTELDDVYNFNQLYVTKYTGNNEDGNYLNNTPSGLYRVFGDNTTPNRPLIKGEYTGSNTGFQGIYGGAQTHHYVQMTVTEFSEFWLHGSQQSQPLPVEMIYLQADVMNNAYIRLSWATAIEVNNRGFEVERSTDGQNWTQIGFVEGHNNATTQHNYNYDDMTVAAGVVYYYRLKQVDYDNAFEYTDIVSARIVGEATFSVKEFIPNPTTDRTSLIVTGTKEQEISIAFYNIVGQKVLESNHVVNKGANTIAFDLARLASGTYTAVVSSANEVYTQKIVLTR